MNSVVRLLSPADSVLQATCPLLAETVSLTGRLAFAGVFAILVVWLWIVPSSRLTDEDTSLPWWRRSRSWAILIAASQMLVYLLWK